MSDLDIVKFDADVAPTCSVGLMSGDKAGHYIRCMVTVCTYSGNNSSMVNAGVVIH